MTKEEFEKTKWSKYTLVYNKHNEDYQVVKSVDVINLTINGYPIEEIDLVKEDVRMLDDQQDSARVTIDDTIKSVDTSTNGDAKDDVPPVDKNEKIDIDGRVYDHQDLSFMSKWWSPIMSTSRNHVIYVKEGQYAYKPANGQMHLDVDKANQDSTYQYAFFNTLEQ